MITYVENNDYSMLLCFIAGQLGVLDCFEGILENNKIPNLLKIKLDNVFEIEQYLGGSNGFFEEVSDVSQPLLIDIGDIDLIRHTEYLANILVDYVSEVFIYSSELVGINAEVKKVLKKNKIEIKEKLKINPTIATGIYARYCTENNIKLTQNQIQNLVEQTISYYEIIDNLDFIDMSGDPEAAYRSLLKTQKPLLFMQGFNLDKLDCKPWYKNVDENELQLALSLIFGKMEKSSHESAKTIAQEVINTDQKIKTSSKLPALVWYRLLLWKAKNV